MRVASAPALVALLIATGCSRAASSGDVDVSLAEPIEPPSGLAEGVYTVEQAGRGERTARTRCFPCHTTAEWSDPGFIDLSSSDEIRDMYGFMLAEMPPGNPGGLRGDQYANLFAYILRLLGAPAGDTELPIDPEALYRMISSPGVTPSRSGLDASQPARNHQIVRSPARAENR